MVHKNEVMLVLSVVLIILSAVFFLFLPVPTVAVLVMGGLGLTIFAGFVMSVVYEIYVRVNKGKSVRIEAVMIVNAVVTLVFGGMSAGLYFSSAFRDFCMVELGMPMVVVYMFYTFTAATFIGLLVLGFVKLMRMNLARQTDTIQLDMRGKGRVYPRSPQKKTVKALHGTPKANVIDRAYWKLEKWVKDFSAASRPYQVALILAYFIPFAILGYVVYMNTLPFGYDKTITLDVGALDDMDCTKDICITKWEGSPQIRYGDETYRELNGTAGIKVDPYISLEMNNIRADLNIEGEINQNIYVQNDSGVWNLYWNPEWDNYTKIKDFTLTEKDMVYFPNTSVNENVEIFVSPKSGNLIDFSSVDSFSEFMKLIEGKTVYVRGIPFENPENSNIDYIPGSRTVINATLRGTQYFHVYLGESFNMSMWKKDRNGYVGKDEYNVSLVDLKGKVVYYDIFRDDDNGSINIEDFQHRNFYTSVSPGVYKLNIDFIKGTNDNSDSYIYNMTINTNKIMFTDHIQLYEPTTFYLGKVTKQIVTRYGHNARQEVLLINENDTKVVNLTEKQLYSFNTTDYQYLNITRGDIHLWFNYIAYDNKSYFEPFKYLNSETPEYLIYAPFGVVETRPNLKSENATIHQIIISLRKK